MALPFIPTAMIEWVFTGFDRIALRKWADFKQIGLYASGFKIVAVISIINKAFHTFWTPTSYRWYEEGESANKFQIVNDIMTTAMYVSASIIVILRKYIILLLAPEYREAAMLVPFLLFIPILDTIKGTTVGGITISRKTYYIIPIYSIAAVINVVGNYLLVPIYGSLGASIATGFSFIVLFWLLTVVSKKLWEY